MSLQFTYAPSPALTCVPALSVRFESAVQGLPIVEKMYPGHVVFTEHPSLCSAGDVTANDGDYDTWRLWCKLQWETYCLVTEHLSKAEQSGVHAAATPSFTPPSALCNMAQNIGARWTQYERTPAAKMNPGMALALNTCTPPIQEVIPFSLPSACLQPAFS